MRWSKSPLERSQDEYSRNRACPERPTPEFQRRHHKSRRKFRLGVGYKPPSVKVPKRFRHSIQLRIASQSVFGFYCQKRIRALQKTVAREPTDQMMNSKGA